MRAKSRWIQQSRTRPVTMEWEGIHALPSFCGIVVIMKTKLAKVSPKALERFVAVACRETRLKGEVNILLTDDRKMRELNRRFRRKHKGHDHERDNGAMARLEQRLRKKLDLPMSLTERAEKTR